jgi:hypothetical protein
MTPTVYQPPAVARTRVDDKLAWRVPQAQALLVEELAQALNGQHTQRVARHGHKALGDLLRAEAWAGWEVGMGWRV